MEREAEVDVKTVNRSEEFCKWTSGPPEVMSHRVSSQDRLWAGLFNLDMYTPILLPVQMHID